MPSLGRLRYIDAPPNRTVRSRGALVLIHAFPLNARMWAPQLGLADQGWHVIAPHLRGMDLAPSPVREVNQATGASRQDPPRHGPARGDTSNTSPASMDDYAADVIDLLDGLHVEDAVIGGLSMGGYVAFALFRRAPRYFRGLVLADTRPQADTPEGVEGRERMLALVREHGPEAVAKEMLPKLLGETTRRDRPDTVARVRELIVSNSAEAIASAISALMTRPDSTPILPTIHLPTLILVGDEDVVTPPALSEDMRRAIPGSELSVIPQAGHLSSLEQPAAFNAALARFLEHRI